MSVGDENRQDGDVVREEAAGEESRKPINLALQGGGSHGAFSWGVLDRLLECGRMNFPAISGTSAGAMNAVALVDGWSRSGADGARQKLYDLWRRVGLKGRFSPLQRTPWDRLWGNWSIENTFSYNWLESVSRTISPNMANPLGINPIREVVDSEIDFDRVRSQSDIALFIGATNVETGQLRVFTTDELSSDVLAASACLPTIFPAIEVDGQAYWDGGYGGNPPLFPLRSTNDHADVLLVQINPIRRVGAPTSARAIQNRIDEITFNASLLRELREIAFMRQLVADGKLDPDVMKTLRLHRIDGGDALGELEASSKLSAEWEFLCHLRDIGRAAADDWLEADFADVGHRETIQMPGASPLDPVETQNVAGPRVRSLLRDRIAALAGH